jgi:hypothetical protein
MAQASVQFGEDCCELDFLEHGIQRESDKTIGITDDASRDSSRRPARLAMSRAPCSWTLSRRVDQVVWRPLASCTIGADHQREGKRDEQRFGWLLHGQEADHLPDARSDPEARGPVHQNTGLASLLLVWGWHGRRFRIGPARRPVGQICEKSIRKLCIPVHCSPSLGVLSRVGSCYFLGEYVVAACLVVLCALLPLDDFNKMK